MAITFENHLAEFNQQLILLGHGSPIPGQAAQPVFELHPLQLTGWNEAVWETWRVARAPGDALKPTVPKSALNAVLPGIPQVRFSGFEGEAPLQIAPPLLQLLNTIDPQIIIGNKPIGSDVGFAADNALSELIVARSIPGSARTFVTPPWQHLMFAYLIENTRIVEIVQRILEGALHDEPFGPLSDESHRWLRMTEDQFFRDGTSSLIQAITSWVRPNLASTRRNVYWRMFGMDLNHGRIDGGAHEYIKAESYNGDFVRLFQELLRELWRGIINDKNESGPNTTDEGAIFELLDRLQLLLNSRRRSAPDGHANLAREELTIVSMMSWFELTVAADSPIVRDLRANSDSREDRLRKLGERVKLPSHGKSRSFFVLADHLPFLLRLIEEGFFADEDDGRDNARLLFKEPVSTNGARTLRSRVLQIINHWSLATGVDLKAVPATLSPR